MRAQRVALHADDAVARGDAGVLGRAALEDVEDAQARAVLAGRAGIEQRADAAVGGVEGRRIAQVLGRVEVGEGIVEQLDHLAQQVVDLVGVVGVR